MTNNFIDDFYQIVYSPDEIELLHQCLNSYDNHSKLTFLKFLRNEFSDSNMNQIFVDMKEGINDLTEEKLDRLEKKFTNLQLVKSQVNELINELQKLQPKGEHISIKFPYNEDQSNLIISSLFKKLNNDYFSDNIENFSSIFLSAEYYPIKWLGSDGELKALFEQLASKIKIKFGSKINLVITSRFYKEEGKPYNLESMRKATGSTLYKDIVHDNMACSINDVIQELKIILEK